MIISLVRTFLLYIGLICAVRLMGKRQISEMQTGELTVMLLISDLAAIPMQDTALPLSGGLIPIVVLVFCELFSSTLMLRFPALRTACCGRPVVVIVHGEVQQAALRSLRMSIEDLFEQLRQKDVQDLSEVMFAIVETNGTLSVVRSDLDLPATPRQLGLSVSDSSCRFVVIDDGRWCPHSLALCHKSRAWGASILQKNHLRLQDVFLMTANEAGTVQIVRRERPKRRFFS